MYVRYTNEISAATFKKADLQSYVLLPFNVVAVYRYFHVLLLIILKKVLEKGH